MTDRIIIEITVKGPSASGKSLAISDLMRGLREAGHFIIFDRAHGTEINMSTNGEEYKSIQARLRSQEPIEHTYD